MLELKKGVWLLGELGVFNLPANVVRAEGEWRVCTSGGTFWQYPDALYGNHLFSLKVAVEFAVTLGSLEYSETLKYLNLTTRHLFSETGVLGVFYRGGLQQQYIVIYQGKVAKVPYCDGKGFTHAVRTLEGLKDEQTEYLLSKFHQEPVVGSDFLNVTQSEGGL